MLKDFVENKRVRLNGIVGFYPANSVGDDIEVSQSTHHTVAGVACFCQYCACTCACLCQYKALGFAFSAEDEDEQLLHASCSV